ncbi:MAG: glycoside hydrolase family 3 C-terminal domain-containing protein [Gemmatimonadetes bacterium]|nr:glycoside hydrolase family 3 C-terminal domain-containing protein [Gemmatimonadota bacterium]
MRFSRCRAVNPVRAVRRYTVPLIVALLAATGGRASAQSSTALSGDRPWMERQRAIAERAQLLLARMTLEEKFWQLFMVPGDPLRDTTAFAHGAYGVQLLALRERLGDSARLPTDASALADSAQRFFVKRTRLGIPAIFFEEGVHGLMQDGAAVFPSAIGLAASWDTALVQKVAGAIAQEARDRGVRQLLAPVINLARDPRWGRVDETYGEDSWLSSAMGRAYVRALESNGVVATPKHFVANHGDGGRDSYPVSADAATLADLHFPPFREAIGAGARSLMASYNSLNGVPASENESLLTRTLRGDWRFGGVVISDQGGVGGSAVLHHTAADYTESTARAMRAGLDVIFQSGVGDARLFWPAVRDGRVPRAALDTAVVRVLRLKFALGLFEQPYAGAVKAWGPQYALAVRAAESSLVLLQNARATLPLADTVKRLVVIGAPAHTVLLGGYSVRPARERSLVIELAARLTGRTIVIGAAGPSVTAPDWDPIPAAALEHDSSGTRAGGLKAEYFSTPSFDGAPVVTRTDATIDQRWTFNRPARGVDTDWFAVRWTGWLEVPRGDTVRVAVEGDDGFQLWIDDTLAVDADRKVSYSRHIAPALLTAGRHALRLQYRQTTGNGRVRLLWDKGYTDRMRADERAIAEAVQDARGADAAVIAVGVDEGEFRDRSSLHLPGRQEELIARVAATGTPVTVIIYSGGAVITTPWMDKVGAILQAFYPGEGGAEAIARVLLGDVSPGGRLPFTVPRFEGQLPLVYDHLPTGRGDDYVDLTGQPLFPFGYGLTFAPFRYDSLTITGNARSAQDTVCVQFWVGNTAMTPGRSSGDEVVQLYMRHRTAPTAQPVLALRGFARVTLSPGGWQRVRFTLPARALYVRDEKGRLVPPTGPIEFFVGASSRDIRLRGLLDPHRASR